MTTKMISLAALAVVFAMGCGGAMPSAPDLKAPDPKAVATSSATPDKDTDGDGIPDATDKCPDKKEDGAAPDPKDGCPKT
jgi:hypothetical protein